jgi:hypothetical protein
MEKISPQGAPPLPHILRYQEENKVLWHVEMRQLYRVVVGKHAGTTPVGRPSIRCQGNIKMNTW